jgi:hypothetical protein
MDNSFLDKPIDALDLARVMGDRGARLEPVAAGQHRADKAHELLMLLSALPDRDFEQAFEACVALVGSFSAQRRRRGSADRADAQVAQTAAQSLSRVKSA